MGQVSSPQTAAISFDNAVTMTLDNNLQFGTVTAANNSTYKVTAGSVFSTVSGTGTQMPGTQTTAAGNVTIYGSASDTISISTGSIVNSAHVMLSAITCSYNGGAEAACSLSTQAAPTGAGKTLLLGVTAAVSGSPPAGTSETPSFTVTVTYT
jgi:hypothetical protein